jgi:hypothetical protein
VSLNGEPLITNFMGNVLVQGYIGLQNHSGNEQVYFATSWPRRSRSFRGNRFRFLCASGERFIRKMRMSTSTEAEIDKIN